jgi:hypothetical protein
MSLVARLAGPVLALGLILGAVPATDATSDAIAVPDSLGDPAGEMHESLQTIADADALDRARQVHADQVVPAREELAPHASDLAPDEGPLLATYLDRLETRLAEGNLSDARSLAGAAAQLVADEIQPRAEHWDENRTALAAGPVQPGENGPKVALVLVNPPPSLAAYDAELSVTPGAPTSAQVALGQGQTRVHADNGTVRWASFDASAMAHLSPQSTQRVALGQAQLDPAGLDPATPVATAVDVNQLSDAEGRPVPAIGLQTERSVPAGDDAVDPTWLTLGGVGLAAAGLGWWIREWEV